jgi:hypothetical protein
MSSPDDVKEMTAFLDLKVMVNEALHVLQR